MNVEYHGAGVISECGIRMGGAVIEELCDGNGGGSCAVGLGRCKGA